MKNNKIKINKKILVLLSGVFIFPNQATEDISMVSIDVPNVLNRIIVLNDDPSNDLNGDPWVANEINNLMRVGNELPYIRFLVERLRNDLAEEERSDRFAAAKAAIENFFGRENLPFNNLGLINNLWHTETLQFNHEGEFPGGLGAFENRSFRFQDNEQEAIRVRSFHIETVIDTLDTIRQIQGIEYFYRNVLMNDLIRRTNIAHLIQHERLLIEQYEEEYDAIYRRIRPEYRIYRGNIIPDRLFDDRHASGLNFEEIRRQLIEDRSNGEGNSFSTAILGYIRTYISLLDELDREDAREDMNNALIETVESFSRRFVDSNLLTPEQLRHESLFELLDSCHNAN